MGERLNFMEMFSTKASAFPRSYCKNRIELSTKKADRSILDFAEFSSMFFFLFFDKQRATRD